MYTVLAGVQGGAELSRVGPPPTGARPVPPLHQPILDEPVDLEGGEALWGSDHVGVGATVR